MDLLLKKADAEYLFDKNLVSHQCGFFCVLPVDNFLTCFKCFRKLMTRNVFLICVSSSAFHQMMKVI